MEKRDGQGVSGHMDDHVTSSVFGGQHGTRRPARIASSPAVQPISSTPILRGHPVIVTMIVTSVTTVVVADDVPSLDVTADIAWTNSELGARHRSLVFSIPVGNTPPAVTERIREAGARFVVEDARAAGVRVGHCGMSVLLFGVVDN